MKMGRMTIRIRKLVLNEFSKIESENLILNEKQYVVPEHDHDHGPDPKNCRICFVDEDEADNPLVTVCKCSGSMKYIHYNCLKMWLKNKMVAKENNFSYTFNLKNLECELCKTELPGKS